MSWTHERTELLRELWSKGFSASEIARQLEGMTRNAVCGKAHRLKLSSQGRAAAIRKNQHVQKVPKKKQEPPPKRQLIKEPPPMETPTKIVRRTKESAPRTSAQIVPISRHLKLVELTPETCKWPSGDPLTEAFDFCGNDCLERRAYCSYHSRLAFQPASERRAAR